MPYGGTRLYFGSRFYREVVQGLQDVSTIALVVIRDVKGGRPRELL